MKSIMLVLSMLITLQAQSEPKNQEIINKQVQEQMKLEEKFSKEQKFYQGNEYDLKNKEINPESLKNVPHIEPDYDFNMDDVYD